MKPILFIALILCLVGCKKEETIQPAEEAVNYPYTQLVGHTWEGKSYVDDYGVPYYQFLHITSDTTVGIYTATYDASYIKRPEVVYPCKITTQPNHADVLEITYLGYSPAVYHTTMDTLRIDDGYVDYTRFK